MNCNSARQYMIFHAEGNLNRELSDGIREHLAGCSKCSQVYEEISLIINTVAVSRQFKIDPWFSGRVEQALLTLSAERKNRQNKWQKAAPFIRVIPVAASMAIALWVGILIGSQLSLKFNQKSDVENLDTNLYENLVAQDPYDKSLESFFLTNNEK